MIFLTAKKGKIVRKKKKNTNGSKPETLEIIIHENM